MPRLPLTLMAMILAVPSLAGSAFGEDEPPPRTPWQKVDPGSEPVVRWVVEGCAAYPVTEDGTSAAQKPLHQTRTASNLETSAGQQ